MCISNALDSVWPHFQTTLTWSKILCWTLHFQLSSQCLEMWSNIVFCVSYVTWPWLWLAPCTLPLAHHTSYRHVIVVYYTKRLLKSELFTEYVQRVIGMGNGSWILHSWFCLCVLQLISSCMYVPEVGAFDPIKHSLLTSINCSDCFTSKAAGL